MADEADRYVVLALLQATFLGKCNDQGLGSRVWPFSWLRELVADCCESSDYILSTCWDHFCWDVVNFSWLPSLQRLYCSLHFFAKDGMSNVFVWGQISTDGSPLALWLYSSEQYSVHWFSISCSSVRHFPEWARTVFHELVCPLTVVLQIFFNPTTLFFYPVFFCLFHAPLDVVVQILQVLIFLFSVLSFCRTD